MKLRSILALSIVIAGVAAAHAGVDMDHIDFVGPSITDMGTFGICTIGPDYPLSGMVVEDFNASGNVISDVSMAFETAYGPGDLTQIKGWQVSVFKSLNDAANSGFNLNANTVAQAFVSASSYTALSGTSAFGGPTWVVDFNNINLNLGATGHYWIGAAAVENIGQNGAVYVLANSAPYILGAFSANNAVGVDPTNGFGQGQLVQDNQNAAYRVETICTPEPISMITVGAGLVGIIRRRRK